MNHNPEHLLSTPIIDADHETVQAYARENAGKSGNPVDQAVSLYYAVRDDIRYNPYKFVLTVNGLKASTTLAEGEAWCVPKAALLAACCRAMKIPARVGYGEAMKTDVFHWHGYTIILLDGNWVKATPAFNRELCEKFRLRTLDFDGKSDSIYHPFDLDGNKHMDYILFRGEYDDVPLEEMKETFEEVYKRLSMSSAEASFDKDVDTEQANVTD